MKAWEGFGEGELGGSRAGRKGWGKMIKILILFKKVIKGKETEI